MAFVGSLPILRVSKGHVPQQTVRTHRLCRRAPSACSSPPQQDAQTTETVSSGAETSAEESSTFLLPSDMINTITQATMLESRALSRIYSSQVNGFSNKAFFECQMALGGVPSLLLGITDSGITFGGYTANGFWARDDYREVASRKSMFVFTVRDGNFLIAEPTDLVQYDFYDYAVRLGAGLLGIPMNPAKHIMKADMATSSCRLPNGETSLFGEYTMAKLRAVEVLVAADFVEELNSRSKVAEKGFFARLFG